MARELHRTAGSARDLWAGLADSLAFDATCKPQHLRSLRPTTVGSRAIGDGNEDSFYAAYEINENSEETLGSGGFAVVRRGRRKIDGLEVAIKCILRKSLSPGDVENLEREVKILQEVKHPHVISLIDVFDEGAETIFLVTHFAQGGDLFDAVSNKGHFSEPQAKRVMYVLLSTVAHLHKVGVFHRDIKLENILLASKMDNKDMHILLADFGSLLILRGPVEGEVVFHSPNWDEISSRAKNLVSTMLSVDSNARPTAQSLLRHRWFSSLKLQRFNDPSSSIYKLRKWTARRRWFFAFHVIRAVMRFIVPIKRKLKVNRTSSFSALQVHTLNNNFTQPKFLKSKSLDEKLLTGGGEGGDDKDKFSNVTAMKSKSVAVEYSNRRANSAPVSPSSPNATSVLPLTPPSPSINSNSISSFRRHPSSLAIKKAGLFLGDIIEEVGDGEEENSIIVSPTSNHSSPLSVASTSPAAAAAVSSSFFPSTSSFNGNDLQRCRSHEDALRISSFLDNDDDEDDDDDDDGGGTGNIGSFIAKSASSPALLPRQVPRSMSSEDSIKIANFLDNDDDEEDGGGTGNIGSFIAKSASSPALLPRQVPRSMSSEDSIKIANFLDNDDDEEEDDTSSLSFDSYMKSASSPALIPALEQRRRTLGSLESLTSSISDTSLSWTEQTESRKENGVREHGGREMNPSSSTFGSFDSVSSTTSNQEGRSLEDSQRIAHFLEEDDDEDDNEGEASVRGNIGRFVIKSASSPALISTSLTSPLSNTPSSPVPTNNFLSKHDDGDEITPNMVEKFTSPFLFGARGADYALKSNSPKQPPPSVSTSFKTANSFALEPNSPKQPPPSSSSFVTHIQSSPSSSSSSSCSPPTRASSTPTLITPPLFSGSTSSRRRSLEDSQKIASFLDDDDDDEN